MRREGYWRHNVQGRRWSHPSAASGRAVPSTTSTLPAAASVTSPIRCTRVPVADSTSDAAFSARSATIVNAELLNRTGELGVVASGARADLIAVDGDPLADISLLDGQGEHLSHIMKDGIFYKRPAS